VNNARRILSKGLYTLTGLLVLVEKASFSEEFRSEFHSGGGGKFLYQLNKKFFVSGWGLLGAEGMSGKVRNSVRSWNQLQTLKDCLCCAVFNVFLPLLSFWFVIPKLTLKVQSRQSER